MKDLWGSLGVLIQHYQTGESMKAQLDSSLCDTWLMFAILRSPTVSQAHFTAVFYSVVSCLEFICPCNSKTKTEYKFRLLPHLTACWLGIQANYEALFKWIMTVLKFVFFSFFLLPPFFSNSTDYRGLVWLTNTICISEIREAVSLVCIFCLSERFC